jgi:hypothetical protein
MRYPRNIQNAAGTFRLTTDQFPSCRLRQPNVEMAVTFERETGRSGPQLGV